MKGFSHYKDERNNSGKHYTLMKKNYIIHTFSGVVEKTESSNHLAPI